MTAQEFTITKPISQTLHLALPSIHHDICCEETLSLLSTKSPKYIVLTDNRCPCYLETLLELKPKALIGSWDVSRPRALELVSRGESYFSVPTHRNVLTSAEREVLRLIALGLEAKGIARRLGNSPGTVNVHVRSVYSKLRAAHPNLLLENHVQLTHFWRGQWHLLEAAYTRY
jgi:DNA-binding NarL/FixJ family response regulator